MNYNKMTKKELITILVLKEKPIKVTDPQTAFDYLKPYGKEQQEHFIVLLLNGQNQIFNCKVVTIGIANRTLVHLREVFAPAIEQRATSIIIAHNHPSGSVAPSEDDYNVTTRLKQAGEIIGISVLDHIIFTSENYYSMSQRGEI